MFPIQRITVFIIQQQNFSESQVFFTFTLIFFVALLINMSFFNVDKKYKSEEKEYMWLTKVYLLHLSYNYKAFLLVCINFWIFPFLLTLI